MEEKIESLIKKYAHRIPELQKKRVESTTDTAKGYYAGMNDSLITVICDLKILLNKTILETGDI